MTATAKQILDAVSLRETRYCSRCNDRVSVGDRKVIIRQQRITESQRVCLKCLWVIESELACD